MVAAWLGFRFGRWVLVGDFVLFEFVLVDLFDLVLF